MNLNSAALKLMVDKGLTLADVAEIVAANEQTRDPTAAERQARCRARKRSVSQRDVTRDGSPNDKDILTPSETPKPNGLAPQSSRGTRLPENWSLPPDWAEWAKERRKWAASEVAEESLLFANYWHSRSGAGATHRDWFKTWQNWVIRSHRADGNGANKVALSATQLRERAEFYDRINNRDAAAECRQKAAALEARAA